MKKRDGYTIISTLAAASTLAVLAVAVTGIAIVTTKLLTENKRHTAALGIVNERLEYIRSLPFHDVGLASAGMGILLPDVETVAFGGNPAAYTVTTTIETIDDALDGVGGADSDGDTVDYKTVKVRAHWASPNGTERDAEAVTYVAPQQFSLSCSACPSGFSCDASIGFCLPSGVVGQLTPTQEGEPGFCIPGTLACPGSTLCPVSANCSDAVPAPAPEAGEACTPGLVCENGAVCSLSGVCPGETCYNGACSGDGVCFAGFCYDPDWYQVSWPAEDWSGPGSQTAMMCQDAETGGQNSCTTTNDCPETCVTSDGTQVVWQCEEQTWVPDCRLGNIGGATPACRGGYDENGNCPSGFVCEPEACPAGGYCSVNGKECGASSSNIVCSSSSQCEVGEVCDGTCRTICPGSEDCRVFWGGFTRGCRPYAITGAVADPSLPLCPLVGGLTPPPPPLIVDLLQTPQSTVTEGNAPAENVRARFTLDLQGQSAPADITVNLVASDGTAVYGADYTSPGGSSGAVYPVTILAGQTNLDVFIDITEDSVAENPVTETFAMQIDSVSGGGATVGANSATGTINDDDAGPPPPLVVDLIPTAQSAVTEGNDPAENVRLRFRLDLRGQTAPFNIPINLRTYVQTAVCGDDYDGPSFCNGTTGDMHWQMTIPAGQTGADVYVDVVEDTVVESPVESFELRFDRDPFLPFPPVGLGFEPVTGTIIDDDTGGGGGGLPPTASIVVCNFHPNLEGCDGLNNYATVTETDVGYWFPYEVRLSAPPTSPLQVGVQSQTCFSAFPAVCAEENVDYLAVDQIFNFNVGETSKFGYVWIYGDTVSEGTPPNFTETFTLYATPGGFGGIRIHDDD